MKYNGFYFWMFKGSMKKVLAEQYGKAYAAEIMKKSKAVYRQLVAQADDIGDDNPMAYNELFALAFVAPYVASGKKIPPETVQEMMRRSLYHIQWYFARTDLNTERGKAENKKSIVKYVRCVLLPHHALPHLRLSRKARRCGADAAVLRTGRGDDHVPARHSAP